MIPWFLCLLVTQALGLRVWEKRESNTGYTAITVDPETESCEEDSGSLTCPSIKKALRALAEQGWDASVSHPADRKITLPADSVASPAIRCNIDTSIIIEGTADATGTVIAELTLFTVTGISSDEVTIKNIEVTMGGGALLKSESLGSVTLDGIMAGSEESFALPVVNVLRGKVILNDCTFEGFTMSAGSFVSIAGKASFVATKVQFQGITSTAGSVINAIVKDDSNLGIDAQFYLGDVPTATGRSNGANPITFVECSGRTGIVNIDMSEGTVDNVVLADVVIVDENIEVETNTAKYVAINTIKDDIMDLVDAGASWSLSGMDEAEGSATAVSNVYTRCPVTYTNSPNGLNLNELLGGVDTSDATSVNVDVNGLDTVHSSTTYTCGTSNNPCQTLAIAYAVYDTLASGESISVGAGTHKTLTGATTLTIAKDVTVTGASSTKFVIVEPQASVITITGEAATTEIEFSTMTFELTSYEVTADEDEGIDAEEVTLDHSIFELTEGSLTLTAVSFTLAAADVSKHQESVAIGAPLITTTAGTLKLDSVTIGVDGGVTMPFSQCSVISVVSGVNFECVGSTFQNIKVTDGAAPSAVISASLTATDTPHFYISDEEYIEPTPLTTRSNTGESNTFKSIKTDSAGAVYLDMSASSVAPTQVTIKSVAFTSCTYAKLNDDGVTYTDTARNMYIVAASTQLDGINTNQGVAASKWTTSDDANVIVAVGTTPDYLIPLSIFTETLSTTYKVGPTGYNFVKCGNTVPCSTVADVSSKLNTPDAVASVSVQLNDLVNVYPLTAVAVNQGTDTVPTTTLTIAGPEGETKPVVALTGLAFTVNSAALTFDIKNIKFVVIDAAATTSSSPSQLAVVTTGILKLSDIVAERLTELDDEVFSSTDYKLGLALASDFISLAAGNIYIAGSTFTGINAGANSIVSAAVASADECYIGQMKGSSSASPVVFDSCVSTGAVVSLDASTITSLDTLILKSVTIIDSALAGSSNTAKYVVITIAEAEIGNFAASKASHSITGKTTAAGASVSEGVVLGQCEVAYEVTNGATQTITLSNLWTQPNPDDSIAYVDQAGNDYKYGTTYTCGWSDVPCATVANAYAACPTCTTIQLSASDDYTQDGTTAQLRCTIARPITIEGTGTAVEKGDVSQNEVKSTLAVDCFTVTNAVTATQTVTICCITFTWSANDKLLLSSAALGTVELNTIEVTLTEARSSTKGLIAVSGGTLKLDTVSVGAAGNAISLSSKPLIDITAATPNIEITGGSAFNNIARSGGSNAGAVLSVTLAATSIFKIVGTATTPVTFTDCKDVKSDSKGGAIVANMASVTDFTTGNIVVQYAQFDGSGTYASSATEQDMYITVNDADSLRQSPKWIVLDDSDEPKLAGCALAYTKDTKNASPTSLDALWTDVNQIKTLGVVADDDACAPGETGHETEFTCPTITAAMTLVSKLGWESTATAEKITLADSDSLAVTKIKSTLSKSIAIEGATNTATTSDSGILFTVTGSNVVVSIKAIAIQLNDGQLLSSSSTGSVTLDTLTVTGVNTANKFKNADVISLTAGSLIITTSTFSTFALTGKSLINIGSGASFDLTGDATAATFDGIKSDISTGGAVITATVSGDATFKIAGTATKNTFKDCVCTAAATDTNTRAPVYITLTDGTVSNVDLKTTPIMTGCGLKPGDSAATAPNIYIIVKDAQLDDVLSQQSGSDPWDVKSTDGSDDTDATADALVAVKEGSTIVNSIPLSAFVAADLGDGAYIVTKNGYDFDNCGGSKGCATVATAATRPKKNTGDTVTVSIAYDATAYPTDSIKANLAAGEVEVDAGTVSLTVQGAEGTGDDAGKYATVLLSKLCFICNTASLPVEVKSLTFVPIAADAQLAQVKQGTLILTSVTLTQYASVTSAQTSAGLSALTDNLNQALIDIEAGASFVATKTTFTSIKSGSNAIINAVMEGAATLYLGAAPAANSRSNGADQVTFSGCTCTTGFVDIDTTEGDIAKVSLTDILIIDSNIKSDSNANRYISLTITTLQLNDVAQTVSTWGLTGQTSSDAATALSTDADLVKMYDKCLIKGKDLQSGLTFKHVWTAVADVATPTKYVGINGVDTTTDGSAYTCGWEKNPCQTVGNAVPLAAVVATSATISVAYSETAYTDASLSLTTNTITSLTLKTVNINGVKDDTTLLQAIVSTTAYTVDKSGVTLHIENIEYVMSAANVGLATVSDGTLTLSGISVIKDDNLANPFTASTISVSTDGSLSITGSSFTGITVNDGSTETLAVISATIANGKSFSLASTTFTKCKSLVAGAVYLDITTVDKDHLNAITISNPTFIKCRETTDGTLRDMYINSVEAQLSTIVARQGTPSKWSAVTTDSADDSAHVIVCISDASTPGTASLPSLRASDIASGPYKVGPGGYDFAQCGGTTPCGTITEAIARGGSAGSDTTVKLLYSTSYRTASITLDTSSATTLPKNTVKIQGDIYTDEYGDNHRPVVSLVGTCLTVDKAGVSVEVKDIDFTVDAASAQLADVKQVKLTLDSIDVRQDTSSIATIGQSLITVANTGNLEIKDSLFSGITGSASVAGAVISASLGDKLEFTIGTAGHPVIFFGCSDQDSSSEGGAIVVDCSDATKFQNYISFGEAIFSQCTCNGVNQYMYITLPKLTSEMITEVLKTTWAITSDEDGVATMEYTNARSELSSGQFNEFVGPIFIGTVNPNQNSELAKCGGGLNGGFNMCNKLQSVASNHKTTLKKVDVHNRLDNNLNEIDWTFADIQLDGSSLTFTNDLEIKFPQKATTDSESGETTFSNCGVSATGTLFTWNSNTKLSISNLDVKIGGASAQVAVLTQGSLVMSNMVISQTIASDPAAEIREAIFKLQPITYENALTKSLIEVNSGCNLDLDDTVEFQTVCSAANGGCVNIKFGSATQLIDMDAKFGACVTNENGGIIFLDVTTLPDFVNGGYAIGLHSIPTGLCYAAKGGDYVALNPSSYTAEALGNIFTTFVNLETKPGQCVFSGNGTDLVSQSTVYTVKASGENVYVNVTTAMTAGTSNGMLNLYFVNVEADVDLDPIVPSKSVKISGTNTLTLKAGSTVFSITEITQVGIALNVESLTIKRQHDADYTGGLLNMDKASYVTFNKMTYDCSGATKDSSVSTIIASYGIVTLIGSTFTSIKSTATFIGVPMANFYSLLSGTTKNTFDTISSTGVNGTIFQLSHPTVVLENMEFKSCSAAETSPAGTQKTGYGGIAYIDASSATTFEFVNVAITPGSGEEGSSVFFINVGSADTNIKYSDFIDLIASNNLTDDSIKYWNNTDKGAVTKISGRIQTAELKVDATKSFLDTLTASDSKFTTDSATAVTIPSGTFKESADAITLDRSVTISGNTDTTIPFTGKDTAFKISGGKAGKIVTVVLKSITLSYYGSTSSRSNDAAQVGSMVSVAQYTTAELNSITIKPDASHNNIILTSSCITSDGNLILTDMTIQDLTLQDKSLIYIKDITKDTFKLTNTNTFTNIVKKEGDGAILSVTLATTSELVITNVTFDSCEASNGNGGVLSITQNGGKLTLKSVTFNNCNAKTTTTTNTLRTNAEGDTSSDNTPSTPTSTEKYDTGCGGCLYVSHSADGTHDMSDLTIKGGSASGFGSVLFITGSISSAILKQYKTLLLQAQGSKQCMYFGADKQTQALDLSNLVPSTIYVDTEGTKTETCEKSSESTKACDLLSSAIQSYYGLGKGIQIATGTYVDTAVYGLPLNRQMSIVGESNTTINITASRTSDDVRSVYIVNPSSDATISFESIIFNVITPSSSVGSVFSLTSTATLALAYVQLIGDGGLMEDSVIRANSGKVDLTGCTIKSFETYSDALIYSYRPTITLNAGNTFDSISRRSGNGAVFEFKMTKGDSFTLIGSKFSKCASKDGRGGAIYIAYDGGDLVIGDEKETKKDEITTIFEGCSAGSSSASNTRVNSGLTNDDAGKTSEDFEDNLPTAGAGGALYVDIYDVDTNTYNFNITSVKFTDCTATKEGNAVYLRAHTEAGTTMLKDKAFWKTMLKMNKASGDFVYADYTNKSKTAPKSPNLLGLWLGLGLGLGLLAIAGVVITIVCCMRKKKISPSEEKKSTEMSPV